MALSMLDIPLPEDDDMSEDEFDGYIDENEDLADGSNDTHGDDGEEVDVPAMCDFQQPSTDMTDKSPLDFFKVLIIDEMLVGPYC